MSELENTQQDTDKREEKNDGFEPLTIDQAHDIAEAEQDDRASTDPELEPMQNSWAGALVELEKDDLPRGVADHEQDGRMGTRRDCVVDPRCVAGPEQDGLAGADPELELEREDRTDNTAEPDQDDQTDAAIEPMLDNRADSDIAPAQNEQTGIAGAARTVSALFSEGMASMKEVNAAHRAHTEARNELDRLDATIASRELELDHRRDVESRYDEIIRSETERKNRAEQERAEAEQRRAEIASRVDELKKQLDAMRDQDATTERRLKSALEAAEDKERSSRESGRRLQRRLDDAQENLERTVKEREEGIAAAEQAVKSAEAHLSTLNSEYAEIQRNPSANPAGYSVRKRELEIEISDAAEALRNAKGDVPRIESEMQAAIEEARASVKEAERPITQAKEAFNAIAAEADRARDAYSEAKEDAEKRQKSLRGKISEHEKEAREQERAAQTAQQDANEAQATLDEANDIHAHPEATISLANALEADRAEREERMREVEELASAEKPFASARAAPACVLCSPLPASCSWRYS